MLPVTLRFPLSARLPNRGALALAPVTLLFCDTSYDAALGSQPARSDTPPNLPDDPLIPKGRGDLLLVFEADRARINRRGTVTFMADLRFERAAEGAVARALAAGGMVDGDLLEAGDKGFHLELEAQPRDGTARTLRLDPGAGAIVPPTVHLATVYELDLERLRESDGALAQLRAGDMLVLKLVEPKAEWVRPIVWNLEDSTAQTPKGEPLAYLDKGIAVSRVLRLMLTDEPVIEPPPSLYAALVRRTNEREEASPRPAALSLPLYAQSPLPWRVDLRDPKRGFRAGYMRRTATFVWGLTRPVDELDADRLGVHIVKYERSGQTFLPADLTGFVKPRRLGG